MKINQNRDMMGIAWIYNQDKPNMLNMKLNLPWFTYSVPWNPMFHVDDPKEARFFMG